MASWYGRWLFTTYHKDVGILYFFTSLYFGFIGAVLALLMRTQLSVPNNDFLTVLYYNQAVTMHGLIMIFWFLSPIAIGLANYYLPLQIGAKDLAFPRLNALSYWLYLAGGILAVISFFVPGGSANAGWAQSSKGFESEGTRVIIRVELKWTGGDSADYSGGTQAFEAQSPFTHHSIAKASLKTQL